MGVFIFICGMVKGLSGTLFDSWFAGLTLLNNVPVSVSGCGGLLLSVFYAVQAQRSLLYTFYFCVCKTSKSSVCRHKLCVSFTDFCFTHTHA